MKLKSLVLVMLAAALALAAVPRAQAEREASFEFFHDSLSPYGEWIEVGDYGLCWRPTGVDPDWSPYSDGYWSYTDAGWTWVSYEDFGGIVYHYGRWVNAGDDGWCWVPDYDWGPAWVSWRSNDDYVGWAPLPPEARWRRDTGFSTWVDLSYDIGPGYYNFCRIRNFGEPVLRPVIIDRAENVTIIANTVNVTNITYYAGGAAAGVVFVGGPSYRVLNRLVARPIPALKLVRHASIASFDPRGGHSFNAVQRGNQLSVLAPSLVRPTVPFAGAKPVKVVPAAKLTKGWAAIKSPEVEQHLREKMKQEVNGRSPENAPAKAVKATELSIAPAKANPNAPSPVRTAKGRDIPAAVVNQPPTTGTPETIVREKGKPVHEKIGTPSNPNPVTITQPLPDGVGKPARVEKPDSGATAAHGKDHKAPKATASDEPRVVAVPRGPTEDSKPDRVVVGKSKHVPEPQDDAGASARKRESDPARVQKYEVPRTQQPVVTVRRPPPDVVTESPRQQPVEAPRRVAPVENVRRQPQETVRQLPPVQVQRPMPVQPQAQQPQPQKGAVKRKLTPEEEAALQKQQNR